ncbi:MAG: 6-carboxytetrahydropterin synthase [Planctomycetota bacterium]
MPVTIMRRIPFCAGHRLLGHEGKCANLHGHNYVAEIYITGDETDKIGRVVDFSVVNRLFKGWIDDNWDHGMLVWNEDKGAIEAIQAMSPNRLYRMPYNPTAENMAKYLLLEISPQLVKQIEGYSVQATKVVIWETENSSAEVTIDERGQVTTTSNQLDSTVH